MSKHISKTVGEYYPNTFTRTMFYREAVVYLQEAGCYTPIINHVTGEEIPIVVLVHYKTLRLGAYHSREWIEENAQA